eukprot:1813296-Rhodomonas_salina.2
MADSKEQRLLEVLEKMQVRSVARSRAIARACSPGCAFQVEFTWFVSKHSFGSSVPGLHWERRGTERHALSDSSSAAKPRSARWRPKGSSRTCKHFAMRSRASVRTDRRLFHSVYSTSLQHVDEANDSTSAYILHKRTPIAAESE